MFFENIGLSSDYGQVERGRLRLPMSITGGTVLDGSDVHSVVVSLTHSQKLNSLSDKMEMDHFC